MKVFFDTEFIEDGRTIDLISIGLVREDGDELYLISSEFDEKRACPWVRENVLTHLPKTIDVARHSRIEIGRQVRLFLCDVPPEFWAYYADYDWVVLCQLYGRMLDLPDNWPKYCRDLKQLADERGIRLPKQVSNEHHALADARWVRDSYYLCQNHA